MSRFLFALIIVGLVAACGSRDYRAPRQLDDACAIVREHPAYLRAFRATERRWSVPVAVQMAVMHQESKFIGNARTPHRFALGIIPIGRQSSAYGYSQALDGTWDEYLQEEGRRSAKRDNIRDATDFMGWYMNLTTEATGVALNDAQNQYLAYHEGRTGYLRGSHNSKAWLLRVAAEVGIRAVTYDTQLRACGRI